MMRIVTSDLYCNVNFESVQLMIYKVENFGGEHKHIYLLRAFDGNKEYHLASAYNETKIKNLVKIINTKYESGQKVYKIPKEEEMQ